MAANRDPAVKTVVQALQKLAEDEPDKEAFVFIDKYGHRSALTRRDVWDKCLKFSAMLKRSGLEKGDFVCNTLVNCPERIVTAYGTIVAGGVTMNGQMLLANGEDLLHNLKTGQCKAIIVDTAKENKILNFLENISYIDETTGETLYKDLPYLKTVIKLSVYDEDPSSRWLNGLDKETETYEEETIQEADIAGIFNTSGTSGFPKLVIFTHRNLLLSPDSFKLAYHTGREDDVFYSNRSLGWFGGFPHSYHGHGSKHVITNHAYGPPDDIGSHMIEVFKKESCLQTSMGGVEVERILERLTEPLPHPLRTMTVGGGTVSSFVQKAIGTLTSKIVVAYGATEFSVATSIVLEKGSICKDYCAGSVFKNVELKILDDKSNPVPKGEPGEIFLKSPYRSSGYYNNAEKTKESFLEDGWYRTGDLGYQDSDGLLFVLGRKANAIMKGSFIFYPGWLEAKILKCPGIRSIALIGVPDPILFEDICLCITRTSESDLDEEKIRTFCKGLFVTSDKEEITPMPKYFLFFDEFPLNANLKIDTKAIKADACKRLGIAL